MMGPATNDRVMRPLSERLATQKADLEEKLKRINRMIFLLEAHPQAEELVDLLDAFQEL